MSSPAWQLGDDERAAPVWQPPLIRSRAAVAGSLSLVEPTGDRAAGDGRTLRGTFSVYNQWQEIRSASEGHFFELIRPRTFAKTIQERGHEIPVLYSHGRDSAIGTAILGKVRSLSEDSRGAHYEVELFDGIPPLLLAGLKEGRYGSSFRARVVKEEVDQRPGRSSFNPKGIPQSIVSELALLDIGPTSLPAYGATSAQVRGAEILNSVNVEPRPPWLLGEDDDEEPYWLLQRKDRHGLASAR
jgi:phage head maturation protease